VYRWAQEIELSWEKQVAYVPSNRTAQALAVIKARQLGYQSVDNGILPIPGEITFNDDKTLKGEKMSLPFLVSEEGPTNMSTPDLPFKSEHLRALDNKQFYLPPGDYPELEPTSVFKEGHLLYNRKKLPVLADALPTTISKDPYGRRYSGDPCKLNEMWCWREKKVCRAPHICPDLETPFVRLEFRGWLTRFFHVERKDVKDLCPYCDRTIKTYFHECRKGFPLYKGDTDTSVIKRLINLTKGYSEDIPQVEGGFKLLPVEEKETIEGSLWLPQLDYALSGYNDTITNYIRDLIRTRGPLTSRQIHQSFVDSGRSKQTLIRLMRQSEMFIFNDSSGEWHIVETT
jgi:hypothetical protein